MKTRGTLVACTACERVSRHDRVLKLCVACGHLVRPLGGAFA